MPQEAAGPEVTPTNPILRTGLAANAAPLNVIYASRGLWSVLLVWRCGHWVQSREQDLGGRVLAWPLAGAGLLMSAIVPGPVWARGLKRV